VTGSACPVIHETYSEPKKSTAFATPPGSAYPAYRDGLNEAAVHRQNSRARSREAPNDRTSTPRARP
jgi:hypothetical protein